MFNSGLLNSRSPVRRGTPVAALALAAAFLVTAGCAYDLSAGREEPPRLPRPPLEMPAAYSISTGGGGGADAGAGTPDRWWEAFRDERLGALVTKALSKNPTLAQARARLETAAAKERHALALARPELTAKVSTDTGWKNDGTTDSRLDTGLTITWELDLRGRLEADARSARHKTLALGDDLEAAAVLISGEVADAYVGIIEQKLQLELLERQTGAGVTLLGLIELRFAYGGASVVDVYQQRQQLASTTARIPKVRSLLRTLGHALEALLGSVPGRPGRVSIQVSEDFPELPPLPATGVPSELLKKRPDLRRIQSRIRAAGYELAGTLRDRLPRVLLRADSGFSERLDADELYMSLYAEASAPLYDWGRRAARESSLRAALREELAAFSGAYITAVREVEDALWREKEQLELLESINEQISIVRDTLSESRARYVEGLTDYLPVIMALSSLQVLERELISERGVLVLIRIDLYMALGGTSLISGAGEAR